MALRAKTVVESLEAFGHLNVTATHTSTFEVTKALTLTRRGNCVIAVNATKGLEAFDPRFKAMLKDDCATIVFKLWVAGRSFTAHGYGCKALILTHPTDIVCRKSGYVCERTLMIGSDKAASDIPRYIVSLLRDPKHKIRITLKARVERP